MPSVALTLQDSLREIDNNVKSGSHEAALALGRKAVSQFGNSPALNNKMAEIYLELNSFSKAEFYSQQSYNQDKNLNALLILLTALIYSGKFEQAISFGADYIQNVEPRIEVKRVLDQLLEYLKSLREQGKITNEEELYIINIYKAYGDFDKAAECIELLKDHHVKLRERKELCRLWAPLMNTRRFINPEYSIEEFFQKLKELKVKYAVLRWFEDLPHIEDGEDIDFLVADEDIELFSTLLVPYPYENAQKIDLYSVSGLPGSAYQDVPYFQANMAKRILNGRVLHKNLYYVPSPRDHFYSLSYHAVYHKAETSGLPVNSGGNYAPGEHNYDKVIKNLAAKINIRLKDTSLTSLHKVLKKADWTPTVDLLRKLGQNKSPWLMSLYPPVNRESALNVFVLRSWAKGKNLNDVLNKWLEAEGITVLHHEILKKDQVDNASEILRGGNWGQGPFPVCGGKPYAAFVVMDQSPIPVDAKTAKSHPFVNNQRFREVKAKLRDFVNQKLPKNKITNCIHCCDDDTEAEEYISVLFNDKINEINKKRDELEAEFSTKYKVLKSLTNNARRAKVELIEYMSGKAVLKTFKYGKERFLNREIEAYEKLSSKIEAIDKALFIGQNKIVLPCIEYSEEDQNKLLKKSLEQVAKCAWQLWENGYAHLDFQPGNLIIDNNGKLHLIDFEMLYKYPQKPSSVYSSYDVAGIPQGFKWDLLGGNNNMHKENMWKNAVGYKMSEILDLFLT